MNSRGKAADMFYSSSATEADNLARLALNAATQLDLLKRGKSVKFDVINSFADAIVSFAGMQDNGQFQSSWLDPASSEMFSSAVNQSTARKIYDTEALNAELMTLIDQLRSRSERFELDRIKMFCLSIHSFILRNRADTGLHERGVFDYDGSYAE